MNKIQKLVVGETTETVIRVIFDHRIAQESSDNALNLIKRASRIKDLKYQVIGFIKRNPNHIFDLIVPEYKSDKELKLSFTNFNDINADEDDFSKVQIHIQDNFVDAEITKKVKIGRDIVLKLKAE